MELLNFNQFNTINESEIANDLHKIYLTVRHKTGQKWLKDSVEMKDTAYHGYKDYAGSKFFIRITEKNVNQIDINPEFPILNYSIDVTERLIKTGKIREDNIYNHPKHIDLSKSKKKFHQFVGEDENLPKTVYTRKAAKNLNFPIIAKPAEGNSGVGIKIFKNLNEFESYKDDRFDLFSELIDKNEEHRVFSLKGKPFFWMQRQPLNDKAKLGIGEAADKMNFAYTKKNISDLPDDINTVLQKYSKIFNVLPYLCIDIMRDKNNKLYLAEINTMPGVPFDSTVILYRTLFEDFYGKSVSDKDNQILNNFAQHLDQVTLNSDKKRFFIDE